MPRPVILSGHRCARCGSDQTSKAGMAKGKQRYKCRACKRFFILDREPQTGKAKIRPTKEDVCHRLNG